MEHFFQPTGHESAKLHFFHVARDDYHGVPFHRYLEDFLPKYSPHEYGSFLQTWLFFCALQNMFGDYFQPSEFIRAKDPADVVVGSNSDPHARVLTTKKLNEMMMTLDLNIKGAKQFNKDHFLAHMVSLHKQIDDCLARSPVGTVAMPEPEISALCSIIAIFQEIIYTNDLAPRSGTRLTVWRGVPGEALQRNGWCLYEARRAWSRLPSLAANLYWTKMPKLIRRTEDHSLCSEFTCSFAQIRPAIFKPRHLVADCKCELFRIDRVRLIQLLEKVPRAVLKIPFKPSLMMEEIELVELPTDVKHIALSHVWADGLGNPLDNALPLCQMAMLCQRMYPLHELHCKDQQYMYIWVDSLCIPTGSPAIKSKALAEMTSIYGSSTLTVVVDSTFVAYRVEQNSDEAYLQVAILIVLSRWMSRLWTLQEAVLPKILYFKFKNAYIELTMLQGLISRIRSSCAHQGKASLALICTEVLNALLTLNGTYSTSAGDESKRTLDLLAVQAADRSLSNAEDEPICLSILVNAKLDTVEFPICFTMMDFWKASCELGLLDWFCIAHSQYPLRQPGFRWAPKSLLGRQIGGLTFTLDVLSPSHDSRTPRLLAQGLMIHGPGIGVFARKGLDMRNIMLSACLGGQSIELLDAHGHHWRASLNSTGLTLPGLASGEHSVPMKKLAVILQSSEDMITAISHPSTSVRGVLIVVIQEHEQYTLGRRLGDVQMKVLRHREPSARRLPAFDVHGFEENTAKSYGETGPLMPYLGRNRIVPRLYAHEEFPDLHRWIID